MIHSFRILPTRPTIKIKHRNGKKKGDFLGIHGSLEFVTSWKMQVLQSILGRPTTCCGFANIQDLSLTNVETQS